MQFCNSVSFAAVNYYDPWWRDAPKPGPNDYIYPEFSFQVGPGGTFLCDFLADLVEALAIVEPEFAVEEFELGEEIQALCQDAAEAGLT